MLKMIKTSARAAYKLVAVPVIIVLALALALFIGAGTNAGYSVLLGGGVWVLPSLYFTYRVFSWQPEKSAQNLAGLFYRAELTKLLLCAVFFVLVIKFLPSEPMIFLMAFIVAQLGFWLTVLVYIWITRNRVI